MVIQECIRSLADGAGVTGEQVAGAMEEIMGGHATPAQIGGFLTGLRMHGETAEVVAAASKVMQAHAEPIAVADVIDICGTGGDGIDTFNVSTAAGFVVAGAGVRVAKHGNRAASSKAGSADLLEALGARIDIGGEQVARVIEGCGFGFLFAQRFHPAMRHVGGPRRELGIRTVFNLLGPLTNPANPKGQLAGVGAASLGPLMAGAFALRGMERAMVVHSSDGLDEISPATATKAWIVEDGEVRERVISPADFGVAAHELDEVAGGDAAENAATLRLVLGGKPGAMADFVVINAGAALYVAGVADDFDTGAEMARDSISSGKAKDVMERYVALTNEVAGG
ncbi:MAG TPA: anthranilate phosphoribosyltransferase [Tepidiformaceae bacterium]|nr:anthranilate phosphoribosyltransferase [Tepidiformaceae bacterium]